MGNQNHFGAQWCQKYAVLQKKLQIKVVWDWISYKKVPERICLSPPGVDLESSKDWYLSDIILYRSGKVDSLSG